MQQINDTIVALATAPLQSALALIRVSGKSSFELVAQIIDKPISLKGNNAILHAHIMDDSAVVDDALLFVYQGPHSFTGENMVEISCHGGLVVINHITSLLIKHGARLAERGEFSQRAFYNGKIDLLQAESINDLIVARNEDAAAVALNGIKGELSTQIKGLKAQLLDILSHIEANIDYPEYEDVEELTSKTLQPMITKLDDEVVRILAEAQIGQVIKNGINVAIIGKPNVGKSSILNALIKEDKAIVSEIEGTTRDVVEGSTTLNGIVFNFLDTAGIRKNADLLESMGIKKTQEVMKKADMILLISENKGELDADEKALLSQCDDKKTIVVFNKSDLTKIKADGKVVVSVKEHNIQPLIDKMIELVGFDLKDYQNKPLLSNARQKGLIEKAHQDLQDALKLCHAKQPVDIIEIDIKESLLAVQELLGDIYQANLSEEIFKRFCLGK